MSTGREIRSKINSIKNTAKITRAMELVAASKMRKAQERMLTSRPYATKIRQVIDHVALSHSEYRHPYLEPRDTIKRVGFIVISSDRGLCGSLNINLFRKLLGEVREWQNKEVEPDFCLIGRKASQFFGRYGASVLAQADQLGDKPSITDLIGVVKIMLSAYDEGHLDALFIGYNHFVNTMTQKPMIQPLLPLAPSEAESSTAHQGKKSPDYWDYIYEPDAKELLDVLLVRYIESLVYQGMVENIASEQAARMVAMKSASENAGQLIDELNLMYNKARQASITQELAEIVSGAAAV